MSTFTTPKQDNEEEDKELEYENYDDEYDDEEEGAIELTTQPDPRVLSSTTTTERPMPSSTEVRIQSVTAQPGIRLSASDLYTKYRGFSLMSGRNYENYDHAITALISR